MLVETVGIGSKLGRPLGLIEDRELLRCLDTRAAKANTSVKFDQGGQKIQILGSNIFTFSAKSTGFVSGPFTTKST